MKLLYLLPLLLALATASFLDFLQGLQHHSSFQRLPSEEKLLFGELVLAAENNELKEFIDRVGLAPVLKLMDHMSQYDAERFAAYLAEHSNYTHHAHGHEDVVNKRDEHEHHSTLWNYLHDLGSSYYHQLPAQEQATLTALQRASQDKNVTGFIDTVGYGAIFGLLEHLDSSHNYQVSRLIEAAMQAEAGTILLKRQEEHHSSSHSHHSNFYSYLQTLNTQYYEGLPEEERQTYHSLVNAAKAHNVTGFIDTVGYGPVFGFIEHLDYIHANMVYDYLANTLNSEAQAAGTPSPTQTA